MPISHQYIFFAKMFKFLNHFLCFLIVEFWEVFVFCIFKPFSRYMIFKYFPLALVCFYILITIFFKEQFLILKKSNLSIFYFLNWAFGIISKKSNSSLQRFFSYVFFNRFIFLGSIFASMIHFELIFMCGMKFIFA